MRIRSIARWMFLFTLSLSLLSVSRPGVSRAGDNAWTSIGLYGATVEAFVIDPNDQEVLWAATSAGIYKSEDGGTTWSSRSEGLPGPMEEVAVNPEDSTTLFAVGQGGVYRSTDAGMNWSRVHTAVSYAVSVSPLDADVVLAGGSWGGGVWRSTDGGDSWQQAAGELPTDMVREMAFAPSAPHIVYAAGFGGLWKSVDHGASWAIAHHGFVSPPTLYSVAVDPYDAQVVYIGTGNDGIYKTTNGGASWTPIGSGLDSSHTASIAIDPGNQQIIYVGGGVNAGTGTPGVYRSLDNAGLSWAPMMEGMGSRGIYHLALDQSTPQNIYAATGGGMWKYTVVSGPEDYSVSINDGALFTNQTAVTLTLTAPAGTTEMVVSNDGGFGDSAWEPFTTEKPWTITTYGSYVIPRVVYAKFRTHGETSGLYQDDIVLDVTAPTGSVDIADGSSSSVDVGAPWSTTSAVAATETLTHSVHLPVVMSEARPGSTVIGLTLSATDDLSGVGAMMISNDASFAGAQWEPFAASQEYWVPESKTTTVYVRYRDRAGNESDTCSATYVP